MRVTMTAQQSVEVLCVRADRGVAGAKQAFHELERRVASLRGRRFYDVLSREGTYRACVARQPYDDPLALGLEAWTIPGGAYARTRIINWPERVDEIAATFGKLSQLYREDAARPSVEFYRSQRELILWLPIDGSVEPG